MIRQNKLIGIHQNEKSRRGGKQQRVKEPYIAAKSYFFPHSNTLQKQKTINIKPRNP